ncbi:KptA family-domain-containing protein [Hypoxylon sp. FL1284]|nr:KptA family-domain-containing protein [Hypoxylon sp. FL1284]
MEDDGLADLADRMEDQASRGRGRGRGGGRGGRGGRGGGKGGRGGGQDRDVLISKALSSLLRHQADNAGIKLDGEGYAPLDKVMQWQRIRSLNATFEEIRQAVADNAKQRFAMKPKDPAAADNDNEDPAAWLIRANQGHSIAVADEALHTPITLEAGNVPDVVVHGTYFAFWPAIEAAGGLKKMARQHVHFGTGLLPEDGEESRDGDSTREAVVSGMRSDAELLVFADVARSLRDGESNGGLRWWLSANGVVLTDGDADGVVPLRYVKEVRGRKQGVGVLWRDGEKVADLPSDVVAKRNLLYCE